MLRTVPLAGGAIPGRAPLRPRSAAMAALYVKRRALVAQLLADRPSCEAKIAGLCTGRTVDLHEPLLRSRGGKIDTPEEVLVLCRACHDWVHQHPAEATDLGLMVHSWDSGRVRSTVAVVRDGSYVAGAPRTTSDGDSTATPL